MIPAQTTVDGALEAAIATGEMLVADWWWVGVIIALAYYTRWYAVAKRQGHKTPEIRGAWATFKHASYVSQGLFVVGVTILTEVAAELAWGFQIAPTLLGGLFKLNPTVWASVSAAFGAMTTGIYDGVESSGLWTFTPRGLASLFVTVFGLALLVRFAGQAAREGLSDGGEDGDSGGVDD